jgi:hypothetical protein
MGRPYGRKHAVPHGLSYRTPQFRVGQQIPEDMSSRQHSFEMTIGNDRQLIEIIAAHQLQSACECLVGRG